MNFYEHDITTMERKVANYKNVKISDKDPFQLFKILQLPSSNDLSDFCGYDRGAGQLTKRMSNRPSSSRRLILPKEQ